MMELSFAFSPCPNDTFMFDALVNRKIKTNGLALRHVLADIEELNRLALHAAHDLTKISYSVYLSVQDDYQLLRAGSALGKGCGPILICRADRDISIEDLSACKVAVPGMHTTANALLQMAAPEARHKSELLFSEIEEAVANGRFDAGVIIHESRFTYKNKGLKKIIDLGEYWEKTSAKPIPLGGIAIKRSLPQSVKNLLNGMMRESIMFGMQATPPLPSFVTENATSIDMEVMQNHIDLYVNNYSVDLGSEGMDAVRTFFNRQAESGMGKVQMKEIFFDQ